MRFPWSRSGEREVPRSKERSSPCSEVIKHQLVRHHVANLIAELLHQAVCGAAVPGDLPESLRQLHPVRRRMELPLVPKGGGEGLEPGMLNIPPVSSPPALKKAWVG